MWGGSAWSKFWSGNSLKISGLKRLKELSWKSNGWCEQKKLGVGRAFKKIFRVRVKYFWDQGKQGPKELRVYGPRSKTEVGCTPKIWRLFAGRWGSIAVSVGRWTGRTAIVHTALCLGQRRRAAKIDIGFINNSFFSNEYCSSCFCSDSAVL